MSRETINNVRGIIGGMAIGLGFLGLLLFIFTVPLTLFGAHFWGGFGFREGPQPTPAQLDATVDHVFWFGIWHRLVPQLIISVAMTGYGFYEASREARSKIEHAA